MKLKFYIRLIAVVLIVSAMSLGAYVAFRSSNKVDQTQVFANRTMLGGLWNNYKQVYWEKDTGRTLDKQQNNITTSEGQSYTMLRAVWQSDKPTFDKSWGWTKKEIQRKDNLFAWRWGRVSDGSYGVVKDQGGQNTASDADSDIALALIMAASRWQQQAYLDEAKMIVSNIWEQEVIMVGDVPYLASNNLEKYSSGDAIINPSYLSPYAFRVFAKIDKDNNWMKLVDSSYDLINKSMDAKLDVGTSTELIPDWVMMNKQTGEIHAPTGNASNLTTHYGYDAIRTPWRLALDYQWNKDTRAEDTLRKMEFLNKQWTENSKLNAIYSHAGTVLSGDEPPEVYGTAIGFFKLIHPDAARDIYNEKLKALYDPNTNAWSQPMNYYSDNWTWFGIALYDNELENLADNL